MNPYKAKNQNMKKKQHKFGGDAGEYKGNAKPKNGTSTTTRKTSQKRKGIDIGKAYAESKEHRRKFTWGK